MRITALFLLLFALATNSVQGQARRPYNTHGPFVLGNTDTIRSTVLKETRTVNIYLPDGYATDSAHYPVIYLLDGSANEDFIHIVGVVQFLNMIGAMPKTIMVGIANIDRKRDFTYPSTDTVDKKLVPTSGGSAKFISFIKNELEPVIQNTYRTNGNRTIMGQSLGGLLATEILLKEPELFDNYIIVSPSLWWDHESLLTIDASSQSTNGSRRVYISTGKEGEKMVGDATRLSDLLKGSKHPYAHVSYTYMPDEDHLTILHNCAYARLKELFKK